jgi:polynucleotide 5'-hydroxyl-kinase GRC3/NOL9
VSLKIFNTPPHQSDYANPAHMHFVGNTAPEGFLVQVLHAVKTMADKSRQEGSQITLVDTTGFIDGPVARILKLHKIEMLRPQCILALQAEDEMEHLLGGYEKMGWQVIRLECSKRTIRRSQTERQKYRNEKYKAYFRWAKSVECSMHKVVFPACIIGTGQRIHPPELPGKAWIQGVNHMYVEKCGNEILVMADRMDASIPFYKLKGYFGVTSVVFIERHGLKDLLVGLNDKDHNTVGLGTINDLDPFAGKLTLFTPVPDFHMVSTIQLGVLKVERGEREYAKTRVIQYV